MLQLFLLNQTTIIHSFKVKSYISIAFYSSYLVGVPFSYIYSGFPCHAIGVWSTRNLPPQITTIIVFKLYQFYSLLSSLSHKISLLRTDCLYVLSLIFHKVKIEFFRFKLSLLVFNLITTCMCFPLTYNSFHI